MSQINNSATTLTFILASVVMILSLLLGLMCFAFGYKNIKLIKAIKNDGFVVTSVSMLPSIQKRSFIRLYSLLTQIITIVLLVAFASITNEAITYDSPEITHEEVLRISELACSRLNKIIEKLIPTL